MVPFLFPVCKMYLNFYIFFQKTIQNQKTNDIIKHKETLLE